MRYIHTAQDIKTNEAIDISQGTSVETLTHRASVSMMEHIVGTPLIVVGKGNNGGDGMCLATYLLRHGKESIVYVVDTLSEVSRTLYCEYLSQGGVVVSSIREGISRCDCIVDCIFGIGLSRNVEGKYIECIREINKSGKYTISADIPSGLNSDTGKVMGDCVRANTTISFSGTKAGYLLNSGMDYVGEVVYHDIVREDVHSAKWYQDNDYSVTTREHNVHKGTFGKVCIIAGSVNYVGASILATSSATACLRGGAGLVTLAVPKVMRDVYTSRVTEATLTYLNDDGEGIAFDIEALDKLLTSNVITIGMGLGVRQGVRDTIEYLIRNYTGNLVIDADGLNALARDTDILLESKCKSITLTPHPKEFSRISGVEGGDIDPIRDSVAFARKYNVNLVLKGSATTIAYPGGDVVIVANGGGELSKGGSGDVLSGIISAMLSQGEPIEKGVYLLGLAGKRALKEYNAVGVLASDLVNQINKI